MLTKDGLKATLLNKFIEKGYKTEDVVQDKAYDTGLEKFCEVVAEAVIEYIIQNAEVHIPANSFVISVAGPGVTYMVNPTNIILTVI